MKQDYFTLHKNEILYAIYEQQLMSIEQLKEFLLQLKENSKVSSTLSFNSFLQKLIDAGLTQKSITIRGHLKIRYTLRSDFDVYKFCDSLEKNSFFSMSTALNIQGLSDFRGEFIFITKERTTRISTQNRTKLTQEAIDNAYKKEPRRTTAYDKIDDHIVVLLEANNTNSYGIIEQNGFRYSSINRAFIEIITNIHYFQSSKKVIDVFTDIKEKLNLETIYLIIEKFDFIYPIFQLAGFYLEQIGYSKEQLIKFYNNKSELNFYTQKNKSTYLYNTYWNIFY